MTSERDIRCADCAGPTVLRHAWHRDAAGGLWRVPVYLCVAPACLEARGATQQAVVPVGGIR